MNSVPAAEAKRPVLQQIGRSLPEFFIERNVFAYMLSGVLLLFGLISYDRIGVDRFPKIDFPIISIQTVLPGASPEIVDSSVANLIETTVNSVPDIEYIQSTSAPGVSLVIIRFGLDKDVDVAFNEVQASPRYPGGMALRFARVKGYRPDKPAHQADTLATVRAIHEGRLRPSLG